MPRIIVETPFTFSPDGIQVVEIEAGEQWVSDRCATVAIEHLGYAELSENQDPDAEPDPGADVETGTEPEALVPEPEAEASGQVPASEAKPTGKKSRTDKN